MPDVTFTVDGKKLTAPAGTLLIDACKSAGIEVPAFCYYPGLSLQAACRMCVVRIEKMPKLQTACTTPVAEGMVVSDGDARDCAGTQGDAADAARQSSARLPGLRRGRRVRAAGHDLQVRRGGHRSTRSPRTIATSSSGRRWCSSTARAASSATAACACAARAWMSSRSAFRTAARSSVIAPNVPADLSPDHLARVDCEQCGMCIDACPVGALTSGTYRYKTRPWEMNHVATICTHCGDGCKTTLGVRAVSEGSGDHPRRQPRQERHERRLPLQQRPLCVRFCEQHGAPDAAA